MFKSTPSSSSLYANPRGPLYEQSPTAQPCSLESRHLSGEVTLDPACYYEQSLIIDEPDVTLDCRGAELRPTESYAINIKRDADRALVKNCYIRGYKGIAVRVRSPREGESDDVRALSPEDVMISNVISGLRM